MSANSEAAVNKRSATEGRLRIISIFKFRLHLLFAEIHYARSATRSIRSGAALFEHTFLGTAMTGLEGVAHGQGQRPVMILTGAPRIVIGNATTAPRVEPAACCPCEVDSEFAARPFSSAELSCGAISAS